MSQMPTQSIIVKIDPKSLGNLIDGGYRLCFAYAVNGQYNVVAKASVITPINRVEWKEMYMMAGSTQEFKAGQIVTGKSEKRRVKLGQKYKLTDWVNSAVITDNGLPRDALGFYNGVPAAPVIYMSSGDGATPIFVDTTLPPKVNSVYTPVPKIVIWFDRSLRTSTMIVDGMVSNSFTINMTGKAEANVRYTDSGDWIQIS